MVMRLPGGFKFLLFNALLGFPVCPLLFKYAPLFLQLFVLGFQVLLHLLMTSLKLQGDTEDGGQPQYFGCYSTTAHAVQERSHLCFRVLQLLHLLLDFHLKHLLHLHLHLLHLIHVLSSFLLHLGQRTPAHTHLHQRYIISHPTFTEATQQGAELGGPDSKRVTEKSTGTKQQDLK